MQKTFTTRRMAAAAVLAAAYCAVSLALAPLSFGAVQMRVSEAFTLLPVFSPAAIWGVTLGCALSNALGSSMGLIDVVFGTSATLIAALMSYALRNMRIHGLPVFSSLPPVLVNAVVIGAEIALVSPGGWNTGVFVSSALSVGIGQIVPCCVLGLLLVWALERNHLEKRIYGTL